MSKTPIATVLQRTIVKSGMTYLALERETGVARASIMRFVNGERTLRLNMADRLAAYFGLELVERRRK
jgi:plasmid maintenance system antidote protein VapI